MTRGTSGHKFTPPMYLRINRLISQGSKTTKVDQEHSFKHQPRDDISIAMGKELFVGTFVHSLNLAQLEVGENGVIGVENGKIVFVEKNIKDLEVLKKTHNFEGAKVIWDLERMWLTQLDYDVIRMSILTSWIY